MQQAKRMDIATQHGTNYTRHKMKKNAKKPRLSKAISRDMVCTVVYL